MTESIQELVHRALLLAQSHNVSLDSSGGDFNSGTHTHAALTRRYKLYVPPGHAGQMLPLVVMLHGCTQDPDDFAAGTAMNERALEKGFFVLYPEQSTDANPGRCWNWFDPKHQARGQGEPALIASMTHAVMAQYGMDRRRVFVAGLSAGGAMAVILAAQYPDIFAAVGVHSGLPSGSVGNMSDALSVMLSGEVGPATAGDEANAGAKQNELAQAAVMPIIVFHGDQDQTVHPRNGERIIEAALRSASRERRSTVRVAAAQVEQGVSPDGRRYTRSTHQNDQGATIAEHWVVHGTGHAWSGGQAKGSYTDARGPDATAEMLRFFLGETN
jgi:poly(hydroxyalkanoate) depolymerase family esterase